MRNSLRPARGCWALPRGRGRRAACGACDARPRARARGAWCGRYRAWLKWCGPRLLGALAACVLYGTVGRRPIRESKCVHGFVRSVGGRIGETGWTHVMGAAAAAATGHARRPRRAQLAACSGASLGSPRVIGAV
jgi:hypothetical protein